MTREETAKILAVMQASYPNYKPIDLRTTLDAWEMMLKEFTYQQVSMALKAFILSDTSAFAPSIGQLVDKINVITKQAEMSELKAWALVYEAICNSTYNAEAEFEKLPEVVKVAIGNHSNLKEWAQMDVDTVQSVEQSHFVRNYRAALEREKMNEKMPEDVKRIMEQTQAQIGVNNG